MLPAPASPRAETKRIAPRCAKASRIGMLWIEITPKAALTPHCSRKAATTAPTVTCVGVDGLCMAGQASRNIDVAARRVRREGRGQEKNRARGFGRKPQATQRDVFAVRELAAPGGPVERLVFARLEAAAPLARLDQ